MGNLDGPLAVLAEDRQRYERIATARARRDAEADRHHGWATAPGATLDRAWHVVQTYTTQEDAAVAQLRDAGFQEHYIPRERRWGRRRDPKRTRIQVTLPLFPGYIFVRFDLREPWGLIRACAAVVAVVVNDQLPVQLPDPVLEALRARERAGEFDRTKRPYTGGELVRPVNGVFADFLGRVAEMPDDHRVKVLFEILGRTAAMTLPVDAVRPWTPEPN